MKLDLLFQSCFLNSNQDRTIFLVTNAKWKFASLCLPRTAQGTLTCLRTSSLSQYSPTCPAQDADVKLSCAMPPAQGTISASGTFGWVFLRWAVATLHQVQRSKKHCWSRFFTGECRVGFPPAVPCVTCASLLWSLPAPPTTACTNKFWYHFTASVQHRSSRQGGAWWWNNFSWTPWSCMSGVGSCREADVLFWEPEQQACSGRKARSMDWSPCATDALYCGFIFLSVKQFQPVQ